MTEVVPELIGDGAKQTPHMIANIEGVSPLMLPLTQQVSESEKLFREGMDALLGLNSEPDEDRAVKRLRQAAEKGHAVAPAWLGLLTYDGRGTKKDESLGTKQIKQSLPSVARKATDGDPDAQFLLAELSGGGVVVEKSEKKAVEWMTKAAEGGHSGAMDRLGVIHNLGFYGVGEDEKKAIEWYSKAAKKGNASAMFNLGYLYHDLQSANWDDKKAIEWMTRAAEKGHVGAMKHLGKSYEYALGVNKDEKQALAWYKKAAALGDSDAKDAVERLTPRK